MLADDCPRMIRVSDAKHIIARRAAAKH